MILETFPLRATGKDTPALMDALEEAIAGQRCLLPTPREDTGRGRILSSHMRAGQDIEDTIALVVGTSGSTGIPKGAQLNPTNLVASARGVDVRLIALLDTVQPANPAPDTPEETKARWQRYSDFAKKTYGLDFPVPFDLLETAGEEALLTMMAEFLATTDASEHGLSAGVLEHQRASFVDNRILGKLDLTQWAGLGLPVILFRAERMHDGAVEHTV